MVDGDAKCEIEALVSCVPDAANEGRRAVWTPTEPLDARRGSIHHRLSFHAISTFVREAIVKGDYV